MYMLSTSNTDEPSTYHHGNLREALLINGLKLLESTQGIDFSMRELTRIIGVTPNAVYRHFANKEQLLTALAIYGFEQLLEAQAQVILKASNPKDAFLETGREYINFAIKNPSLFRLMYGRFAVSQEDEKLKSMADLFYTGLLYAGATAYNTTAQDPQAQTRATLSWGIVHGLSHLIIDGQFNHLNSEELETMINDVLKMASL